MVSLSTACMFCPPSERTELPWIKPGGVAGAIAPLVHEVLVDDAMQELPVPFSYWLFPLDHPTEVGSAFDAPFPPDWERTRAELLGHIPGLRPHDDWTLLRGSSGRNNGMLIHPCETLVVGRDVLLEGPSTKGLVLAEVLLKSRCEAGTFPPVKILAQFWREARTECLGWQANCPEVYIIKINHWLRSQAPRIID